VPDKRKGEKYGNPFQNNKFLVLDLNIGKVNMCLPVNFVYSTVNKVYGVKGLIIELLEKFASCKDPKKYYQTKCYMRLWSVFPYLAHSLPSSTNRDQKRR
jgi:hypothetical protein